MSEAERGGFFLQVSPAIVYIGMIFYAGSMATGPLPELQFVAKDKALHLVAFLGMQVTLFRAVRWGTFGMPARRQLLLALALTSAVGALLEGWQALLPHRTAELADWIADSLGAALGALLLHFVYGRQGD